MKVPERLKSRKFWITVVTGLVVTLNDALGIGLDEDTITQVVTVVAAYVVGQGVVDATISNSEAKKYQAWISTLPQQQTKKDPDPGFTGG